MKRLCQLFTAALGIALIMALALPVQARTTRDLVFEDEDTQQQAASEAVKQDEPAKRTTRDLVFDDEPAETAQPATPSQAAPESSSSSAVSNESGLAGGQSAAGKKDNQMETLFKRYAPKK